MVRAVGYVGRNRKETYQVLKDGEPFDLEANGITKVEVVCKGQSISSDTESIMLDGFSLTIDFGDLGLPSDTYSDAVIYTYSDADTEGTPIVGPGLDEQIQLYNHNDQTV